MKQQLQSLWNLIKLHPLYALLVPVVVIAALVIFSNAIGNGIEHWKQSRFDARQQAYEKQIGDLKAEREQLIRRADEAEAKATLKEAEAKELHDLIDAKGGQIEKAADDLEKQLEEAKRNAGNCANAPDQRGCLCAKLRALGFECN